MNYFSNSNSTEHVKITEFSCSNKKTDSTCSCMIQSQLREGGHPIGLLAGCLTGLDPSGERKTSDRHLFFFRWHWHSVFFVTANRKLKELLHIAKLALDTSKLTVHMVTACSKFSDGIIIYRIFVLQIILRIIESIYSISRDERDSP